MRQATNATQIYMKGVRVIVEMIDSFVMMKLLSVSLSNLKESVMFLQEKIFLGNLHPLFVILLFPFVVIFSILFRFIVWLFLPNKQKFCKHEWESKKLEATYGVFGGMEVYTCRRCGKENWGNTEGRLERNGLL